MTAFVVADLHLGDQTTFTRRRGIFPALAAMHATIAARWDAAVSDADAIYILGDVGRDHALDLLAERPGTKHLILGNADDPSAMHRSGLFASIRVARWLPGIVLTHIPVHESQLADGAINVHGHLHARRVPDPRYMCVSVEQTDYAPIPLDHLRRHGSPWRPSGQVGGGTAQLAGEGLQRPSDRLL